MSQFNPAAELSENIRSAFFIGGDWRAPTGGRTVDIISPDTEERLLTLPVAGESDVDAAIRAARDAFDNGPWPRMSGAERGAIIGRIAAGLTERFALLSRLWTAQIGAPVGFANMFTGIAPAIFEYYAHLASTYTFAETRPSMAGTAHVRRDPVGVAGLIVPWNAALPLLSFKLAAGLAAGCTVVVKTPVETPLEALVIAEVAEAAGLPKGVLNVVTGDRDEGKRIVASPLVDKIAFTGSTEAGKAVAKSCIDRMARFTLELGGKSAAVLLDDVRLDTALPALAPFTMPLSGQICFAQTRVLAPRSRIDEVVAAYSGAMAGLTVGDPWSETTHLGPVANQRQLQRVMDYVDIAKREGARLVTGGERSTEHNRGFFFQPTVFTDVTPDMRIAREEVFGPVVVVMAYEDEDDAARIANSTDYGLTGTVFTEDVERGAAFARRMDAGNVTVNGLEIVPSVPFGGTRQSGMGREGGPEGLEAYLESKAVYVPGSPA